MHELAIAESIVRIAQSHADGRRVTKVYLKAGPLAFGFELVAQETSVEGAELVLEEVPAAGKCRACGSESRLESFPLQCKACGSFDLEIVAGEELYVESLEIEDQTETQRLIPDA